jgi:hypothetical protein
MAVRPDVPWYWRTLGVGAVAISLVILVWLIGTAFGAFDRFHRGDSERAVGAAPGEPQPGAADMSELRAHVAQADRQLQIERAAAADLAKQVKALAFENAALKEDLAFFQSLASTAEARQRGISVNRFRLQPEAVAGEFRYQMLLVQSGQRVKDFQGRLQFALDIQEDGRKLVMIVPPEGGGDGQDYLLNFKYFRRVEGSFKLPPGSVLKGIQVRIFENGSRTPKLTQSLSVS